MKRLRRLAAAALLAAVATPASAQPVLIRMATIVPDGSAWHLILKEMGEKWKTASGGRVILRLFPGGVQGDDPIVVSKMRLGTLDAGLLTSVGIGQIDRGVYALQIPMMYASYEELDYVLDHMNARLEQRLADKGFVLLNWADGGRVYFFTKQPVLRPDDLKALKIFTWQGDSDDTEVWQAAGFNPVPLPSTEVTTALQTGLVTAMPAPPQAAVVLQWYQHARNMTDIKWLFLLGGSLIKKSTWDRIPADAQPAIREAAREAGRRLRQEIRGAEARDIEAMRKRGLNVVHVDEKTEALWRTAAESAYGRVRGPVVPAESFDEAKRLRDEFRQRAGSRSSAH
jgi:TRAP-type C4-dicarboxylate transport system substrate-binding protein